MDFSTDLGSMDFSQMMSAVPKGAMIGGIVCGLIVMVIMLIAQWKLFTKAGEAGWKCIIPIYNLYTFIKIVDDNGVKFLLLCIPVVNIVYAIMLCFREAKAYGKGGGFGFGLLILPFIFTLVLAFGSAQYVGPKGIPAAAPAAPEA